MRVEATARCRPPSQRPAEQTPACRAGADSEPPLALPVETGARPPESGVGLGAQRATPGGSQQPGRG